MNYYELLEISPSASVEVIRNAYKTLAKKYHPDTYNGDTAFAEEKMKLLNEAVSILEDEGKRNEYNKINGINSKYGRNNMLNFDENGESIFFSYDLDNLEDSDVSGMPDDENDSYMDIIDSFINSSVPEKKSKKKSKKIKEQEIAVEEDNADIADDYSDYNNYENFDDYDNIDNIDNIDIFEDISEINSDNYVDETAEDEEYGYENYDDNYDNIDNYDNFDNLDDLEEGSADDPDFKAYNVARNKSNTKTGIDGNKIYYIGVAFLVALIVFLGAMIIRAVDLNNIKNLFSNKQDNPTDAEDAGNFGLTDEEDTTEATVDANQTTTLYIDVEFITEIPNGEETTDEEEFIDPTEPVQPVTEATTPANINITQAPTTIRPTDPPVPATTVPSETKPPETQPPATEPETEPETTEEPTTEEPTEEITEPTTEEPTEEPTPEETEAPTEPEPETEPEETVAPVDPDDFDVDEES